MGTLYPMPLEGTISYVIVAAVTIILAMSLAWLLRGKPSRITYASQARRVDATHTRDTARETQDVRVKDDAATKAEPSSAQDNLGSASNVDPPGSVPGSALDNLLLPRTFGKDDDSVFPTQALGDVSDRPQPSAAAQAPSRPGQGAPIHLSPTQASSAKQPLLLSQPPLAHLGTDITANSTVIHHPALPSQEWLLGPPRVRPLSSLEEVVAWSPGSRPWDALARAQALSAPLASPPVSLSPGGSLALPQPQLLVCHDMKGGYLSDAHLQGILCTCGGTVANASNASNGRAGQETHSVPGCACAMPDYRIWHWHLVDTFIYFSHDLVTIPPPAWTVTAHRHGTLSLGTFVTEFDRGAAVCREFLASDTRVEALVHRLTQVARYFGFDGWLVNIENIVAAEQVPRLVYFVQLLTKVTHAAIPGSRVLWFDGVTVEGKLEWQQTLNAKNAAFFDACDGLFTNYPWKATTPAECAQRAGKARACDVWMGIDVHGRNTFGGGGFQCDVAINASLPAGVSTAVFAPGWVFESHSAPDAFLADNQRFWDKISDAWCLPQPTQRRFILTQLPFSTCFDEGMGMAYYLDGVCVSPRPWSNLMCQSIQPRVVIGTAGGSPEDFQVQPTLETAWEGGSCLKLWGALAEGEGGTRPRRDVHLFDTCLSVPEGTALVVELAVLLGDASDLCIALQLAGCVWTELVLRGDDRAVNSRGENLAAATLANRDKKAASRNASTDDHGSRVPQGGPPRGSQHAGTSGGIMSPAPEDGRPKEVVRGQETECGSKGTAEVDMAGPGPRPAMSSDLTSDVAQPAPASSDLRPPAASHAPSFDADQPAASGLKHPTSAGDATEATSASDAEQAAPSYVGEPTSSHEEHATMASVVIAGSASTRRAFVYPVASTAPHAPMSTTPQGVPPMGPSRVPHDARPAAGEAPGRLATWVSATPLGSQGHVAPSQGRAVRGASAGGASSTKTAEVCLAERLARDGRSAHSSDRAASSRSRAIAIIPRDAVLVGGCRTRACRLAHEHSGDVKGAPQPPGHAEVLAAQVAKLRAQGLDFTDIAQVLKRRRGMRGGWQLRRYVISWDALWGRGVQRGGGDGGGDSRGPERAPATKGRRGGVVQVTAISAVCLRTRDAPVSASRLPYRAYLGKLALGVTPHAAAPPEPTTTTRAAKSGPGVAHEDASASKNAGISEPAGLSEGARNHLPSVGSWELQVRVESAHFWPADGLMEGPVSPVTAAASSKHAALPSEHAAISSEHAAVSSSSSVAGQVRALPSSTLTDGLTRTETEMAESTGSVPTDRASLVVGTRNASTTAPVGKSDTAQLGVTVAVRWNWVVANGAGPDASDVVATLPDQRGADVPPQGANSTSKQLGDHARGELMHGFGQGRYDVFLWCHVADHRRSDGSAHVPAGAAPAHGAPPHHQPLLEAACGAVHFREGRPQALSAGKRGAVPSMPLDGPEAMVPGNRPARLSEEEEGEEGEECNACVCADAPDSFGCCEWVWLGSTTINEFHLTRIRLRADTCHELAICVLPTSSVPPIGSRGHQSSAPTGFPATVAIVPVDHHPDR
eukprot:jgi/Mesvir1/1019/Mv17552-RA.1